MTSSKEEMSRLAAELYSVVCVECRDVSVELVAVINDLLSNTHSEVCSVTVCLSGIAVRALDFQPSGHGFDSQSGCNQGT